MTFKQKTKNSPQIVIDPRFRMSYASFYIKGLMDSYGRENISYNLLPDYLYNDTTDYRKGFVFLIGNEKVYIDFDDPSNISKIHYDWCDIYGKVNCLESDLTQLNKLKAIGPSFGINILDFHFVKVLWKLFWTLNKPVRFFNYLKDYLFLIARRKSLQTYLDSKSEDDYVFSISTLWYDSLTAKTTNKLRGNFLQICKSIFKEADGGFFYIDNEVVLKEFPQYKDYKIIYKEFIHKNRISSETYINKTKKSCLVFNTPSVEGCLGWKLGEYFAMGKAIVSTKLNHALPKNIDDEIIFINDETEMYHSVLNIKNDGLLRKKMELKTRQYFEDYLSPSAVIKNLIS